MRTSSSVLARLGASSFTASVSSAGRFMFELSRFCLQSTNSSGASQFCYNKILINDFEAKDRLFGLVGGSLEFKIARPWQPSMARWTLDV
jgi:hypothetical protein